MEKNVEKESIHVYTANVKYCNECFKYLAVAT